MKDILKMGSIIVTLILFVCPIIKVDASNKEYVIKNYDVNITVNEDNTLQINETINAYFYVNKHGIYRKIPIKNEVVRLDGTTETNRAKISNIYANESYSVYTEDDYKVVKIGDADYTTTGEKSYFIRYKYKLGKDKSKDYDELYFNIIGNEWDTSIKNVTFTITMPKEFDATKIGFSSGKKGSVNSSLVNYSVEGNVIKGNLKGSLNENEALTIRIELPEGYFVIEQTLSVKLLYIIPIAGLIISFILWFIFGKDDTVETVEFYPPEGFNSLELGFLYKGEASEADVTSLLVYLANKGYIKITEYVDETLFIKTKEFKITKLKEYDGNNSNERLFLDGLFSKGKYNDDGILEVTLNDLYDSFYKTMNLILDNVNTKTNINTIVKSSFSQIPILIMIIISLITIIYAPINEVFGFEKAYYGTLLLVVFFVPFCVVPFLKFLPLALRLVWSGLIIYISVNFLSDMPLMIAIRENMILLLGFLLGIICIIGMIYLFKLVPKRTTYGNQILGKIKGFKNFLETAEKEKLEAMVMQNPTYFYDILPYTYVLGISDKWIKKFEAMSLQAPNWYDGYSSFDMNLLGDFMNTTLSSASSVMSNESFGEIDFSGDSISSSSSDSSSGGGSSSGGSGGGGGGSW